jgi:peptidylprolyl isomerase
MKQTILILLLATGAVVSVAQTTAKTTTAKPANTRPVTAAAGVRLPPGVPAVHGTVKTAFSLRYEEIKIGTGKEAEPNKIYKVHYTGWLASDGRKFDSSYDRRAPVAGADGKPEMGADGKPKLGEPLPISVPQGFGRVIPGFDQGFNGMRIGGKRRLFIPWQLAYGMRGRPGPDAANPGIPPKADLIFDIELVAVDDLQLPANHPGMGGMPGGMHPVAPGGSSAPGTSVNPTTPSTSTTPATTSPTPTPAAPSTTAVPPADKPQSN